MAYGEFAKIYDDLINEDINAINFFMLSPPMQDIQQILLYIMIA